MFTFRYCVRAYTILLLFSFTAVSNAAYQANDISLAKSFPQERLQEILLPPSQWHPFPKSTDREAWENIPEAIQQVILHNADNVAKLEVPVLPASVYLQYKRNGNRSNYQNLWYQRRERLHVLAVND